MSESYFNVNAMNASTIKQGAKSMLAMNHHVDNPIRPTAAMRMGTLRHMALLEPEKFSCLVTYDGDKRRKEYKDLRDNIGDDCIISTKEKIDCMIASEVVMSHSMVKELGLLDGGVAEVEYYWQEPQGKCKAKLDYVVKDRFFVDYKTTQNIGAFLHQSKNLAYHLQLGWYWRACGLPGYFIVQESNAPYDVAVYEAPEFMHPVWWRQCLEIWERYKSGDRSGAYSNVIVFEVDENDSENLEIGG